MSIDENKGKIELTTEQKLGLEQAEIEAQNLINELERQVQAGLEPAIPIQQAKEQLSQIKKMRAVYG